MTKEEQAERERKWLAETDWIVTNAPKGDPFFQKGDTLKLSRDPKEKGKS
jgi:hypothetical protein